MLTYPSTQIAPVLSVAGPGVTLVDLVSSDPSINDPQQLIIENSTPGGSAGVLFRQTNGFNSAGAPGLIQFNGPDFGGTGREYAALAPAMNYQKTGAIYGDYEFNFANNSNFYAAIVGAVASQYPQAGGTPCTMGSGGAIGATTATFPTTAGWPADGALDLYGLLLSTNNGNNLDEEFVHITNKATAAGTVTITFSATKAAHTAGTTLGILDPSQGPAIYHAPANGAWFGTGSGGGDTTPMSLGCGASPWDGIFLNPQLQPEGAGTTYQITRNDFAVYSNKNGNVFTLPPIIPASSTIAQQGQLVYAYSNVGTLTLQTSAGDVYWDATTSKTFGVGHGILLHGMNQQGSRVWFPLSNV